MEAVIVVVGLVAVGLWLMVRLHRVGAQNRTLARTVLAMDKAHAALAQHNKILEEALQDMMAPGTAVPITERALPLARRKDDIDGTRKPELKWDEAVRYDPASNQFLDNAGRPV